ncbi:MAG: YkgJ family cysteine cluster protein, partial [Alphaproteobacteria bacterium]
MERRFSCTACGKCCHGLLPIGIDEALAHADKFPLVVIWTPIRQGAPTYNLAVELGITIKLKKKKFSAVEISPTA